MTPISILTTSMGGFTTISSTVTNVFTSSVTLPARNAGNALGQLDLFVFGERLGTGTFSPVWKRPGQADVTSTATGNDQRTAAGLGTLTMVSPSLILARFDPSGPTQTAFNEIPLIATVSITVPEPAHALATAAAIAALVVAGTWKQRKQRMQCEAGAAERGLA